MKYATALEARQVAVDRHVVDQADRRARHLLREARIGREQAAKALCGIADQGRLLMACRPIIHVA